MTSLIIGLIYSINKIMIGFYIIKLDHLIIYFKLNFGEVTLFLIFPLDKSSNQIYKVK